ncbi:MAG: 50S ribosomal protein L24 [Propionibacteriaceae bacterium]|nr:50S ribosomal protein L24 [Propionibacteriaceae bacterium]
MLHIKKNDHVKILTGEQAGTIARVIQTYPAKGKVKVEGVNIITRHVKDRYDPRTGQQTKGGAVSSEAPIDASNVQLVVRDGSKDVGTRLASVRKDVKKKRRDGSEYDGTRGVRISVKTGKEIAI